MAGVALAALMGATRGHHFATLEHLPSASWAVFFLAGVYLSTLWVFPALLAEAAFLDFAAVTWGGVDSFCISPAYVCLLPAYGMLWLAGRWYARGHRDTIATLLPLTLSLLVGTAVCELISSGSFYFLSGRFEQTSLTEFALRLVEYFPRSLSSLLFYVGIAGVIHTVLSAVNMSTALSARFRISG
jgi:hypothetical protein